MLLESRAFCFQPFTSFLEKVGALCGIMEFQWNQIIATKNWHYIEPFIEKSVKIKIFTFTSCIRDIFFIVSAFCAFLGLISEHTVLPEPPPDRQERLSQKVRSAEHGQGCWGEMWFVVR